MRMITLTLDTIDTVARQGTTAPAIARLRGAHPAIAAVVVDFPFVPAPGRGASE